MNDVIPRSARVYRFFSNAISDPDRDGATKVEFSFASKGLLANIIGIVFSLRSAIKQHEKRATMVLELEEKVAAVVKKLKERGLVSPYLRSFVVARINPLRWIKGEPPPLEGVLKTMRERVAKFNVEKIKPQDLAGAAGPRDDET